jgi:hypothetical protein
MNKLALSAALAASIVAFPAQAQSRVQAPSVDPVMARLVALQAQLDALKQSAGRQVVVLHFTPTELPGWPDNNYNNNQQRSTDLCKQALDDRYGRVISYRIRTNDDRFFFSHVVCETKT